MVNREYLLEQFHLAEEYLGRARAIAGLSLEAYVQDKNAVDASVRQLTVLFETCHNIGKHLISRHEWRAPGSKAETFEILAEHSVLPLNLVEAFQGASRFRNLVTYQTAVVRDELVYEVLKSHLEDFDRFLSCVARWLESENPG
ncbi:MAG: DUF86 domain-containing protein [Acidobacteriota bacterium]